jgi:hypothetical protein
MTRIQRAGGGRRKDFVNVPGRPVRADFDGVELDPSVPSPLFALPQ